jgi:hypothetical protein
MNYYLNAFNEMLRKRQENQMGRGGDGRSANPQFDALTNAEKAAYYADNPTMAAFTQFGQKALAYAPFGIGTAIRAQQALVPDFVREQSLVARGIDPGIGIQGQGKTGQTGLYGDQFAGMPAPKSNNFMDTLGRMFSGSSVSLNPVEVQDREATPVGFSSPTSNFGKESTIPTAGIVSPGMTADVYGGGADAPGANADGFGGGDAGFGGGSQAFNQGGMVTPERLMGRAPAPDDGYGALQGGEYVITKAAVEKYGKRMMDAINNGTFR